MWNKATTEESNQFNGAINVWRLGSENWYLVNSGICQGDLLVEWSLYQKDMHVASSDCEGLPQAQRWALKQIYPD